MNNRLFLCLAVVGLAAATPAFADDITIGQYTAGTSSVNYPNAYGQSFTTPDGGPWDNITFSFFSNGIPSAVGSAFIFSFVYTGTATGLTGAPYLAASTNATSSEYVFAPGFTLEPDTTYYVFSNGILNTPDFCAVCGPLGSYLSINGSKPFGGVLESTLDYTVQGDLVTTVTTPEPSTPGLLELSAGAFLLFALARRKRTPPSR